MAVSQEEFDKLKRDFAALSEEFYRNNFSARQDFPKYSNFLTRIKMPHYASTPTVGDVGELVEVGTKLYICTVASATAPTWVVVGTQT